MPEFLHQVPISNNTPLDRIDHLMCPVHVSSLLSDGEIQCFGDLFIAECPCSLGTLVSRIGYQCGDIERGFGVAGIAHLGVSCSVVDDDDVAIEVHKIFILLCGWAENE